MFNSGGQTYQGGQFLYGGLSNFGQSIGQSIIEARARADKAEQDAGADMVMFKTPSPQGSALAQCIQTLIDNRTCIASNSGP